MGFTDGREGNRIEPPLTPFTGAAENSSLGLFFDDDDGQHNPVVYVSLNDPVLAQEFHSRLKTLERDNLGVSWGLTTGSETDDTSRFHLCAVEVSVMLKGEEDERTEVFRSAALVPFSVATGWVTHIVQSNSQVLKVVFPDASHLVEDVRKNRRAKTGAPFEISASKGDLILMFEIDDEVRQEIDEDMRLLQEAVNCDTIDSKLFNEEAYEVKPMFIVRGIKE